MLLTGSEVAKAVRTALLNLTEKVEEKAPQLVEEMVQEQGDVMKAVALAFTSGDIQKTTEAFLKITSWQAGKISEARAAIGELQTANKALGDANMRLTATNESLSAANRALAGEYTPYKPRDALIRIVRACNRAAGRTAEYIGAAYREFYNMLESYEHICVTQRHINGKTGRACEDKESLISTIKDDEWPRVMRVAAVFANRYCVDLFHATNPETVEKYGLESVTYNARTYSVCGMRTYKQ